MIPTAVLDGNNNSNMMDMNNDLTDLHQQTMATITTSSSTSTLNEGDHNANADSRSVIISTDEDPSGVSSSTSTPTQPIKIDVMQTTTTTTTTTNHIQERRRSQKSPPPIITSTSTSTSTTTLPASNPIINPIEQSNNEQTPTSAFFSDDDLPPSSPTASDEPVIIYTQTHPNQPLQATVESDLLILRPYASESNPPVSTSYSRNQLPSSSIFFSEPVVLVAIKLKRKDDRDRSATRLGNVLGSVFGRRNPSPNASSSTNVNSSSGGNANANGGSFSASIQQQHGTISLIHNDSNLDTVPPARPGSPLIPLPRHRSNPDMALLNNGDDIQIGSGGHSNSDTVTLDSAISRPSLSTGRSFGMNAVSVSRSSSVKRSGGSGSGHSHSGSGGSSNMTTLGTSSSNRRVERLLGSMSNIMERASFDVGGGTSSEDSFETGTTGAGFMTPSSRSIVQGPMSPPPPPPTYNVTPYHLRHRDSVSSAGSGAWSLADSTHSASNPSSSYSSHRKVLFKIITPTKQLFMFASSAKTFRAFRDLVDRERARVLAGEEVVAGGGSDGRVVLKHLKGLDETNRLCAGCGAMNPEWVAVERRMLISLMICEACSGLYRGNGNFLVQSFMYDILLFQDTQSPIYKAVYNTINSESCARLLDAEDAGLVSPRSKIFFRGPTAHRRSRSLSHLPSLNVADHHPHPNIVSVVVATNPVIPPGLHGSRAVTEPGPGGSGNAILVSEGEVGYISSVAGESMTIPSPPRHLPPRPGSAQPTTPSQIPVSTSSNSSRSRFSVIGGLFGRRSGGNGSGQGSPDPHHSSSGSSSNNSPPPPVPPMPTSGIVVDHDAIANGCGPGTSSTSSTTTTTTPLSPPFGATKKLSSRKLRASQPVFVDQASGHGNSSGNVMSPPSSPPSSPFLGSRNTASNQSLGSGDGPTNTTTKVSKAAAVQSVTSGSRKLMSFLSRMSGAGKHKSMIPVAAESGADGVAGQSEMRGRSATIPGGPAAATM
ncbi:Arf-GAP with Rho-GAP domain, ANK repeat and PH domain-containing protein 3 [Blyttiomyces sp. JEL0837]|nr:Arf-GAP with Rho-GAP domain, ANK repeat and PH domain-containing protein 3 [Blyttiomyces sp. JEL0837]